MDSADLITLDIYLLGRFSVRIDGRHLAASDIEGRKARSLLKLVALQRNRQIVRDQAMDILWPSLGSSSAAAQLYKAIHHIRKAFSSVTGDPASEDLIEISDDVIRLSGSAETDAQRFEDAARGALTQRRLCELEYATSLYTGDLLPTDLYNEWTSLPREHLRQLYLDVLLALGDEYQRRRRMAHAAETFRLALAKDPWLEAAHRSLMRIFALQGQRTRAARQFETCRQILRDELDVEPEAETIALHEAITERRIWGGAAEPESVSPLSLNPLIDRHAECRRLEMNFENLASGRGSVVVFEGPVGVGKTRLVQELAARGRRRGFRILTGRVREMEGSVSYEPFIDILNTALHEDQNIHDLIPQELAESMPAHAGNGSVVPSTDRKAAQGYLFAQVGTALQRLSTPDPAVVIIEDLHAADEGSFELFHYLARHAAGMPILLAATVRTEPSDTTGRVRTYVRSLAREIELDVVSLQPLERRDHDALLEQFADPEEMRSDVVEAVYRLSEGNPLFAVELFQYHSNHGSFADLTNGRPSSNGADRRSVPPSLADLVGDRSAELSPGARHLLYLLAVLGREISYDVLENAWRGGKTGPITDTDENLFDLLDELLAAGLIVEQGLQYRFRHTLVRQSIYESISEARRSALHALAARTLLELHPEEDEAPVEHVAFHFKSAGDLRQAAHYLILAGRRAESVYAHEDALRCLEEALDVLQADDDTVAQRTRSRVYHDIGDVYRASGRLERSYDAYEQALELSKSLHLSRSDQATLHLNIALVAIFRTEMDRAKHHLDAAEGLVAADEHGRVRVLILRALYLWHLNELEESYRTAQKALESAESIGATVLASQACEILAMACLPLGRWEEGLAYEKRRHFHGWSPDVVVATDAHLCLWEYHVNGDRPFQEASTFMERVSEQAARLGDYRCVAVCHYALGTMHLWRGDSEKAGEELEASLKLHDRVGSPAGMAYALARKAVMHTVEGALDQGWDAVQEGIEHAAHAAVRDHCLQRLYGIGLWNRLEAGDLDRTHDLVVRSEALMRESRPCSACALELYPWLAFYYLETGSLEQAEACTDTVNALAEMTGNPIAHAVSTMVTSSIKAARNERESAVRLRGEALQLVEDSVVQQGMSPITHFLDRMIDQQSRFA